MKYIKPELEIEKFSIVEEITGEGLSAGNIIIDETNPDPGFENFSTAMGDAIGNIFSIK